jgi:putative zinc binding protein
MVTMTFPSGTLRETETRLCRFCHAKLQRTLIDLGMSPLCETYPSAADLNRGEVNYSLHVYVCENCFLVQLQEYEAPERIFSDYPYSSSFSNSWLKYCENYCDKMIKRLGLTPLVDFGWRTPTLRAVSGRVLSSTRERAQ